MHAKTKYTELWLIRSLIYVEKIHQFLSSIKKDAPKRKLVDFFLPHGVVVVVVIAAVVVISLVLSYVKVPA